MRKRSEPILILVAIKLVHTAVWLFFAGCIVAIFWAGVYRQFSKAAALSGVVFIECAILASNRGCCPLTDMAGHYTGRRNTEKQADNFDIYLPLWLARHNKLIFGTLFAVAELVVLGQWLVS